MSTRVEVTITYQVNTDKDINDKNVVREISDYILATDHIHANSDLDISVKEMFLKEFIPKTTDLLTYEWNDLPLGVESEQNNNTGVL